MSARAPHSRGTAHHGRAAAPSHRQPVFIATAADRLLGALALALVASAALAPSAHAAAPTLAQGQCIERMNKGGAKLADTQLKLANGCLKSAAAGRLDKLGEPPQDQTAQACLTNDLKGKLAKATLKLQTFEATRCLAHPGQLPEFAYTDAATVDTTAREESLDVVSSLFGDDLDLAVIDALADKFSAKCQDKVLKSTSKLVKTLFKEAQRAKKTALRCSLVDPPGKCAQQGIVPVTSLAELETFVFGAIDADVKEKIAKAAGKIGKTANKSCTGVAAPIATAFPEECSGAADLGELAGCAEMIARRHFCLALNRFDGFGHDCGVVTQISIAPPAPVLLTRDTDMVAIDIDSAAPAGGFLVDLLSDDPALVGVPATATIPPAAFSEMIALTTGVGAGMTTIRASAPDVPEATADVTVTARGFSIPLTLIGVGRSHDFDVVLDEPAPVGGAMLSVSSLDVGVATVTPPSLFIPEGQTTAGIQIDGVAEGSTSLVIDGIADGYEMQSLALNATDDLVDLPSSKTLAKGIVTDVLVLIAPDPAPPGGGSVAVVSTEPGIVEVLTPTVFIAEGEFDGTAQVRALTEDAMTTVTASLAGFAPDVMAVTTESSLEILESFSSFSELDTDSVFVRLEDPFDPLPAPAGGVSVSLFSDDTDCVSVAASTTIVAGQVHATFDLSYGGVAATPCDATVTASNATYGFDTVLVTVSQPPDLGAITIASLTGTTRVGGGLHNRYRASLASGAHGGITLQIESTDPALAFVAPDATTAGDPVIEVFVPDATQIVDFWVQGIPGAVGSASVTASQARFTQGTLAVDVEAPVFDLLSLTTSYNVSSIQTIADDSFQARTGLSNAAGTAMQFEQPVSPLAAPLDVTFTTSDVAIAELVTPTQAGASVVLPIAADASRTAASFGSGGVAARYDPPTDGVTTIEATAAGFVAGFPTSDEDVSVTVTPATITVTDTSGIERVGAGLQQRYRVTLSGGDHGGVTVRVTSDTPAVAIVAPDGGLTAGAAFVDLVFADQDTIEDFYVQGVAGTTGGSTLTGTAAGFTDGVLAVAVEAPVLDILGLSPLSYTITTVQTINDDPFQVRTGLLNTAATAFQAEQPVSAAAAPLSVSLSSSDIAVAQVGDSGGSGAAAATSIAANVSRSPTTVGGGGVQAEFEPTSTGTSTIAASAAGFAAFDTADEDVDVTVNPASMTVTDTTGVLRLGGGLQQRYRVTLSGGNHGGVTVRVTSDTPAVAIVAADGGLTAGSTFVDLVFADQQTIEHFYVQGVTSATGSVTLTGTAPGFTDGVAVVGVETPVLDILGMSPLSYSITTVQTINDDPFQVRTGIRNTAGTAFQVEQPVSAAAAPLSVTATSSDIAVAQVGDTGGSGAAASTSVAANASRSPTTVGGGGVQVEFNPTSTGTSTIATTAAGFAAFDSADEDIDVTVNPASMTVTDTSGALRLGGGLQQRYRVTLSGGDHGGVTVRVTSGDPSTAIVAPDGGLTAGSTFVDLVFADQDTIEDFYVQGVSGTTGNVALTATAPGFTNGVTALDVEAPVLDILALSPLSYTITTVQTINDDPFQVRTGIRNTAGSAFQYEQPVSAAAAPLSVSATSSDIAVAQVGDSGGSGAAASTTVAANASRSPTTVGGGGVQAEFDPTSTGTATIAASAAGFAAFDTDDEDIDVTVDPASMTVTDTTGAERIGAGLQQRYRVTLSGGNHGGVTVRVASDDPNVLRVALDATTAGTSFVDIVFADQDSVEDFWVQGVLSQTGTVTVTGSAPGFTDGDLDVEVETPVFDPLSLATTHSAGGADDPFQIRTGIRNTASTAFQFEQPVSADIGPLSVTVSSSAAGVAQLTTTASTGASVSVDIATDATRSATTVAGGGVGLDPLSAGGADITASATGFASFPTSDTDSVTVNP